MTKKENTKNGKNVIRTSFRPRNLITSLSLLSILVKLLLLYENTSFILSKIQSVYDVYTYTGVSVEDSLADSLSEEGAPVVEVVEEALDDELLAGATVVASLSEDSVAEEVDTAVVVSVEATPCSNLASPQHPFFNC